MDMSSVESPVASREQQVVDRVLSSRHFAKAPLLSSFLSYVCRHVLDGGTVRISEYEIGVNVFNRAAGFDPREDNIVRTYARQLRKRLQEYYATDGQDETLCIEIPKGGYVPAFTAKKRPESAIFEPSILVNSTLDAEDLRVPLPGRFQADLLRFLLWGLSFLVIYSTALYWLARHELQSHKLPGRISTLQPLWAQLFNHDRDTFIVPGDIGFVILQQANRRAYSLAEYLSWYSADTPASHISMSYLKGQTYTSMLNLNMVSSLQKLPEAIPDRFVIRAVSNIRFDDLRDGNAILLGSNYSNPWDDLFIDRLNFHFANHPEEDRYWIVNQHPAQGEPDTYEPSMKSYSHSTYAVIAFLPNLNGTGHVLLVQGLDAAGTQAAADMLFGGEQLQPILRKVETTNGHLRGFELLIEATSLGFNSHATGSHIVASRFYP